MTSLAHPLAANLLVLLLMLLASSVVKATLNLTLQYEIKEDRLPGTVIGNTSAAIFDEVLTLCSLCPCRIVRCNCVSRPTEKLKLNRIRELTLPQHNSTHACLYNVSNEEKM